MLKPEDDLAASALVLARLEHFEGIVSVQSTGGGNPDTGEGELAVTIDAKVGAIGLGYALGAIINSYLATNPQGERIAGLQLIQLGLHKALSTGKVIDIQNGGAH